MITANVTGSAPEHVSRITPQITVDEAGNITWVPGLIDYNASVFSRGKTVTNDEFNDLFLHDVYQGNYITDSLSELFNEHLRVAIHRSFTTDFNLVPSYIKNFVSSDWGELQSDGYYYITIPASEHGFVIDPSDPVLDRMNIDTELYFLGSDNKFYEALQIDTDTANTVRIYTDDNSLSGFAVIRLNDKSYALSEGTIDATQITGLATVAKTGLWSDVIGSTNVNAAIESNTRTLNSILSDTESEVPFVHNADYATRANQLYGEDATINNIPISNILTPGSSVVRHAALADTATAAGSANEATHAIAADNATEATYASSDHTKGTIEQRLTNLGFSEDDIVDSANNVVGHVKRQGNYVIGEITQGWNQIFGDTVTLPEKYRPKVNESFGCKGQIYIVTSSRGYTGTNSNTGGSAMILTVNASTGLVSYTSTAVTTGSTSTVYAAAEARFSSCKFGYEANPIE